MVQEKQAVELDGNSAGLKNTTKEAGHELGTDGREMETI
jgi:hypothetical protein